MYRRGQKSALRSETAPPTGDPSKATEKGGDAHGAGGNLAELQGQPRYPAGDSSGLGAPVELADTQVHSPAELTGSEWSTS